MLKIYKCVKPYEDIYLGTYWVASPYHYMFQKVEYSSKSSQTFRYIPPFILKEYFVELKPERK